VHYDLKSDIGIPYNVFDCGAIGKQIGGLIVALIVEF
jgi:hypothetical protein